MTLSGDSRVSTGIDPDVALATGGDSSAFERLYRTHVARIHSLARRMLGPSEADEVTQDIFVRAWQKLGQFRGEAAFGTWLHRLAVNVSPLRSVKTSVKVFDIAEAACSAIGSILVNDVIHCRDKTGDVAGCVDRLTTSSKLAVSLLK